MRDLPEHFASNPVPTFDWDSYNVAHLAKHQIEAIEAEQVVLNRPIDLQ
jgi:hypothetical protein